MIKALVFDIDNTLYDYDAAHREAYRAAADYACQAFGLPAEDFDALHRQADRRLRAHTGSLCAAVHNRLIRYQLMLEQMRKPLTHAPEMADRYWSSFLAAVKPVPGVAECLAELKAAGYTIGIGTNMTADYQFAKLERLKLLELIDFLVSSEEAGAEKPEARLFACCVKKAGCAPADCVFVGDNLEADILGAQRAGLYPVWLSPHGEDVPGVCRIRALTQLPDLLRSLQRRSLHDETRPPVCQCQTE